MDPRVIEPGERMALEQLRRRYPHDRPTVFDVGANVGDYATEVLARIPRARLFCFEPQGTCHIGPAGQVRNEVMALGDHNGVIEMWRDRVASYHAGVHRRSVDTLGEFEPFWVTSMKLDDYCALTGVQRIDWLKIDVEGHELSVLAGAEKMLLLERISVIQFEFNSNAALAGATFLHFWTLLHAHGFELYREADALELIPEYDSVDEVGEPLRNYLAVHRTAGWMVA